MSKRLEVVTNLALLAAAVIVGVQAVWHPFNAAVQPAASAPVKAVYKAGDPIHIDGVDFSRATSTMLMVIRKGCHFCEGSMPFYKALTAHHQVASRLRIVAVAPDDPEVSRATLTAAGVTVDQVAQVEIRGLRVSGTPTVLMVDSGGIVRKVWVGQLDAVRQRELAAAMAAVN
jgi:hypothetical protein